MTYVHCRVTILSPAGETALSKQTTTVPESALRAAGTRRTLSVVIGPDELPSELVEPSVARDSEIVVTYYFSDGETRTYSGDIIEVTHRGSHFLIVFQTNS